ncbi:MAG: hypothetical protein AAF206_16810 [Bacteroidota bacterium]
MKAIYPFWACLLLIFAGCSNGYLISQTHALVSGSASSPEYPTSWTSSQEKIQIALVLDTSKPMQEVLEQARAEFWLVIDETMAQFTDGPMPILEIALIEYGNKKAGPYTGFTRMLTPFSRDVDLIANQLYQLGRKGKKAFPGAGLQVAVNGLKWSRGEHDLRMIVIAGQKSFHRGPVDPMLVIDQAQTMDIEVNTIFFGHYNDGVRQGWYDAAARGNGTYTALQPGSQPRFYQSSFDPAICQLNAALNATYVPYGPYGPDCLAQQAWLDNYGYGPYGPSWLCVRTIVKAYPLYDNPRWDLVDAWRCGFVNVGGLDCSQLPPDVCELDADQREDYLREKLKARTDIQKRILSLRERREGDLVNKRRTAFQPNQGSFGGAMLQTAGYQIDHHSFPSAPRGPASLGKLQKKYGGDEMSNRRTMKSPGRTVLIRPMRTDEAGLHPVRKATVCDKPGPGATSVSESTSSMGRPATVSPDVGSSNSRPQVKKKKRSHRTQTGEASVSPAKPSSSQSSRTKKTRKKTTNSGFSIRPNPRATATSSNTSPSTSSRPSEASHTPARSSRSNRISRTSSSSSTTSRSGRSANISRHPSTSRQTSVSRPASSVSRSSTLKRSTPTRSAPRSGGTRIKRN